MSLPSVILYRGDITKLECDAIVNAANKELSNGGGVNGAIHQAAGPGMEKACAALDGCGVGKAKITLGFDLPARNVIHAVGPVYRDGSFYEKELLTQVYQSIFNLARQENFVSIAIPNISTGIYNYPKEQAASIALRVIKQEMETCEKLKVIILCCYDEENYNIYFRRIFGLRPEMIEKIKYFRKEFSNIDPLVQINMYSNLKQEIRYAGIIKEFIDFMQDEFIDFDFQWMPWQHKAKEIMSSDQIMDRTSLEDLCKLLMFIVGADTRINGYMAKQLEEGRLVGAMDRILNMIEKEYVLADGSLL